MSRFEETIAALDVELSEEEIKYLEEPYQPYVSPLCLQSRTANVSIRRHTVGFS
jgi:diketogulonate reductase-like aldo/keto reductase